MDIYGRTYTNDSKNVVSTVGGITITQVNNSFLRRDGANTATDDLNLDSHKIINLSTPTNSNDAATKAYVDSKSSSNFTNWQLSETASENQIRLYTDGQPYISNGHSIRFRINWKYMAPS